MPWGAVGAGKVLHVLTQDLTLVSRRNDAMNRDFKSKNQDTTKVIPMEETVELWNFSVHGVIKCEKLDIRFEW